MNWINEYQKMKYIKMNTISFSILFLFHSLIFDYVGKKNTVKSQPSSENIQNLRK